MDFVCVHACGYVGCVCVYFSFPGPAGSGLWDLVTLNSSECLEKQQSNNSSQSYYIIFSSIPIMGLVFPSEIMKAMNNKKTIKKCVWLDNMQISLLVAHPFWKHT